MSFCKICKKPINDKYETCYGCLETYKKQKGNIIMIDSEEWETKIERKLRKLLKYLKYKNHGFCRKYLKDIIKDFFENK